MMENMDYDKMCAESVAANPKLLAVACCLLQIVAKTVWVFLGLSFHWVSIVCA